MFALLIIAEIEFAELWIRRDLDSPSYLIAGICFDEIGFAEFEFAVNGWYEET